MSENQRIKINVSKSTFFSELLSHCSPHGKQRSADPCHCRIGLHSALITRGHSAICAEHLSTFCSGSVLSSSFFSAYAKDPTVRRISRIICAVRFQSARLRLRGCHAAGSTLAHRCILACRFTCAGRFACTCRFACTYRTAFTFTQARRRTFAG